MCIAARKGDGSTKKVSNIQQAKDAFASRLVAVRNMLTPRGMPTLDNKGPTRDRGPVRLCLSTSTRALGRDGARSSNSWFLLVLAIITYMAFLMRFCTATGLKAVADYCV